MNGQEFSKKFSELRPFMPRGFRDKIVEACENINLGKVKRALRGEINDTEVLAKISAAASKLARAEKKRRRRFEKEISKSIQTISE